MKKPRMEIVAINPAHQDERGYITNIIEDGRIPKELKRKITHVAVYTSKKGTIRGDHYHPKQIQAVHLISGKLVMCWPNVAHAQVFLENSVLLNLTDGERESEKFEQHTIKYQVE